ncbi:MAG: hypothetical protein ABIK65_16420 [Candidatus Eisenbacteria bacterium]
MTDRRGGRVGRFVRALSAAWVLVALLVAPPAAAAEEGPVRVTPGRASVGPGESVRFTLEGTEAEVEWEVIPRFLGDIDGSGLFRAGPREGRGIVRAVVGGTEERRVGHAVLLVGSGRPRGGPEIRIRPRTVRVLPGESVRFRAEEIDPSIPVVWTVRPNAIGAITPDGVFTANEVLADAGSRQLTRREGVVVARAESGGGVIHGRARILIGGEELPGELVIEPRDWVRDVAPADVLSGKGVPFRARFVGPSFDTSPVVEWRVEPPGVLRPHPPVGNRTVLSFAGNVTDIANAFPYRGRLIAEWLSPNGLRIGASAPLSIRLENGELDLAVTPSRIDLGSGESIALDLRASLPAGPEIAHDRLLFFGTVIPPRLGAFHNGSRVFVAGEAGEGTLVIVARGFDPPLEGRIVVPVVVRGAAGNTDRGSAR